MAECIDCENNILAFYNVFCSVITILIYIISFTLINSFFPISPLGCDLANSLIVIFLCFHTPLGTLLGSLGLLWGPSWGTLGGKSGHFRLPFWRFPKRLPLWCHFEPFWDGFGSTLGTFGDHVWRILGSFWKTFRRCWKISEDCFEDFGRVL